MADSISLSGDKFYVLVSDEMVLFDQKEAAIADLKDELADNEEATVAEISFSGGGDGDLGTFEVEPVSWRDIALGVVQADSE